MKITALLGYIMKNKQLILAFISGMVFFTGCSTEASYKVSSELSAPYVTDAEHQKKDDDLLANTLQDKLDDALPDARLKVLVNNSNVLLVGQVHNLNEKNLAANICDKLPSVKQVFNYLTVTVKPSLNVNSSISKKVVKRLSEQNDINDKALSIITVDDIVYIMGTNIGNLKAMNKAIRDGVYSLPDVKDVVNLEQPGDQDYFTE